MLKYGDGTNTPVLPGNRGYLNWVMLCYLEMPEYDKVQASIYF